MSKEKKYWANTRTFSTILKVVWILVIIFFILSLVKSCAVCSYRNHIIDRTGYLPDNENLDNIPDVIPPYKDEDTVNLPDRVMLEYLFPPIGDQGDKGTCVAWAVGYNLKTALNAIDSNWNTLDLQQTSNQTSPRDLWLCIPQGSKGKNCSGASFEAAFTTLMTKGATTMDKAPYGTMKGCEGIGIGDTNNRVVAYYHVVNEGQLPNVGQLKSYIADTIPLVIGARLGDRFMRWRNDKVIDHDTYNYTGMHAYHAMALVGYDDGLHAFRLRNSWGEKWGDDGSIWVDYRFFCDEMCYIVLMAETHVADSVKNISNDE